MLCQLDRCTDVVILLICVDTSVGASAHGKFSFESGWEYCFNIPPSFHLNRYADVGKNILLASFKLVAVSS